MTAKTKPLSGSTKHVRWMRCFDSLAAEMDAVTGTEKHKLSSGIAVCSPRDGRWHRHQWSDDQSQGTLRILLLVGNWDVSRRDTIWLERVMHDRLFIIIISHGHRLIKENTVNTVISEEMYQYIYCNPFSLLVPQLDYSRLFINHPCTAWVFGTLYKESTAGVSMTGVGKPF